MWESGGVTPLIKLDTRWRWAGSFRHRPLHS